jgi:protoporphyrinogen oxidase
MSNKKVVIVGCGITGITAAYFEAKKGNSVTLIDSDNRPGGLLKSDLANDRYFDYGTHIMPETGVKELDDFLFSGLNDSNCIIEKNIYAGSYFNGTMNDKSCYVDTATFEKAVFNQGCMELLSSDSQPQAKNLQEFLIQKFGKVFYENVYKPIVQKYMGKEPKDLAVKVGEFFDMSRLLAFNHKTTKRLCELDLYNSKLGHHVRVNGVSKYYPKEGGVGSLISLLMDKLSKEKIDIKLSTNIIKINQKNGKVTSLVLENEEVKVDKLIWTLPSSYLLYLAGIDKRSSPPEFRNTGLYDFTFEKSLNSLSTFINVYDTALYSGRVTLYQNLTKSNNFSCTVEVLVDDEVDLTSLIESIQRELVEMGIVDKDNKCTFKQYRPIKNGFPILTNKFTNRQDELSEYCQTFFKNILFVGRTTGKVFFMNEVLVDTYKRIENG